MAEVLMRHPDITVYDPNNLPRAQSEEQFEQVWKSRGWVRVTEAELVAEAVIGEPVTDLGALTRDQLLEVAEAAGVAVPSGTKKDDIAALLEAAPEIAAAATTPADDTQEA